MKYALLLLLITVNSMAYDARIKNEYGRVTGYVKVDDNKVQKTDKYGRTEETIYPDGKVKDKYNNINKYITK